MIARVLLLDLVRADARPLKGRRDAGADPELCSSLPASEW